MDLDASDPSRPAETDFSGYYAFQLYDATNYGLTADMVNNGEVTVQANKNTVFYYVSRDAKGNAVVDSVVVGYKNTTAVTVEDDILAMYAVATNVSEDSGLKTEDLEKINYWVADVIVIETEEPVVAISKNVALVYNVANKTYKDYAGVNALDNTAADVSLTVINLNGDDYNEFEQSDIITPWFYTNSVDKNGDSYLRQITRNYGDYGIYAATVDRVNGLYEYFKTVDGETIEFNEDTLPVYSIAEKTKANELSGDLSLKTGANYIVYAVKDKAVYAIQVDTTKDSVATKLYNAIYKDANPDPIVVPDPEPVIEDNLYSVTVKGVAAEATGGKGTQADPFTYVAELTQAQLDDTTEKWIVVKADDRNDSVKITWSDSSNAKTGTGSAEDSQTGAITTGHEWLVECDGVYYDVTVELVKTAAELISEASAGDTIKLPAGTYDSLTIDKNLIIDGSNGVKLTGVINLVGPAVTNVTIQNCEIEVEGNTTEGCVVSNTTVADGAVVTIKNNVFTVARWQDRLLRYLPGCHGWPQVCGHRQHLCWHLH